VMLTPHPLLVPWS